MADTAEIAVTVEPEPPVDEKDVIVKQPAASAKDAAVDDLAEQFTALKERTKAAEQRAAQAAQEVQKARQEVASARTNVVASQYDTVTQGLSAAQAEAAAAEQEYATAMEAGDFAKAGKAQRRMSAAEARIVRLDEAKADIEAAQKAPPRVEQPVNADPVEAYIQARTEPTANWLREHRDWIADPKKNAKLTAAHHDALSEGYVPDTKDYFDHVESFIGLKKADAAKTNGASQPKRKASAPVAPVSGSGGGVNGGSQEVRLTASEARAAQDGTHVWNYDDPTGQKKFKKGEPIGIQEMARRKLEMTKQGFYDRTYLEQ